MSDLPIPTLPLSEIAPARGSLHRRSAGAAAPSAADISVAWARHQDEVREAQRLRHAVFVQEMGARIPASIPGHDIDLFDDFCEHLLVRDTATGEVTHPAFVYIVGSDGRLVRQAPGYADAVVTALRQL